MRISIITATYNAATTVADCLASVRAQTVPVEHIIIDGASTDGTLEIVKAVSGSGALPLSGLLAGTCVATTGSSHIVSEPDNGIYDAMNKGVALATGDVIGILNADDYYATPDVLAKVAAAFEDPRVMSCYGDLVYVRRGQVNGQSLDKLVRYWKAGSFNRDKFKWGWMPPHPTFFVRRNVYDQHGLFNLNLGSAADYELMLRFLYKQNVPAVYIPEILVKMRTGGASNASFKNRIRANRMDRAAWRINGLKPYPWTLFLKPIRKSLQWFSKPCSGAFYP